MRELSTQEVNSVNGGAVPLVYVGYVAYKSAMYIGGVAAVGFAGGYISGAVQGFFSG